MAKHLSSLLATSVLALAACAGTRAPVVEEQPPTVAEPAVDAFAQMVSYFRRKLG